MGEKHGPEPSNSMLVTLHDALRDLRREVAQLRSHLCDLQRQVDVLHHELDLVKGDAEVAEMVEDANG